MWISQNNTLVKTFEFIYIFEAIEFNLQVAFLVKKRTNISNEKPVTIKYR